MKITPFDTLSNPTPLRAHSHIATCFDISLQNIASNHHLYLVNTLSRLPEYTGLKYYTRKGGLFVRFLNVRYETSGSSKVTTG